MKTLIVFALVCAMMVLTRAGSPRGRGRSGQADSPRGRGHSGQAGSPRGRSRSGQAESHLVKRSISCPSGWSDYSYRYFPTRMTWAKAERNCQSMGGHLASVHNILEFQEIQKLIVTSTHSNVQAWIGGSDAQEKNEWFWSDGTSFNYSNWCPGRPNNYGGRQHCIEVNHSARKCWDDLECSFKLPSVCAKKRERFQV